MRRREPTPWAVFIPFALVWLLVWMASGAMDGAKSGETGTDKG